MDLKIVIALSAFAFVCAYAEKGGKEISCIKCSSGVDKEACSYTTFRKNGTVAVEKCQYGACVKRTELKKGTKEATGVKRRCLEEGEVDKWYRLHDCAVYGEELVGNPIDVEVCVCHNDECNGVSNPRISTSLMIITAASVLLSKLF